MINDGFGDDLTVSEATIEADIEGLATAIRRQTWSLTKSQPTMFEDCVQEALIAAWQERAAHPHAPLSHAMRTAHFRVLKVLGGGPLTGEPRHAGRKMVEERPLVTTNAEGEEHLLVEPEDRHAPKARENVEMRDDIFRAVRSLDDPLDQVSVHLRFWADMEWGDVAKSVGRPPGSVMRRWSETIKPALALSLSELRT